jgi:hypothetical protein
MAREIAGKEPGQRNKARIGRMPLRLSFLRCLAVAPHRTDRFT